MKTIYALVLLNLAAIRAIEECTPNEQYGLSYTYPKPIYACDDTSCHRVLVNKKKYTGCQVGDLEKISKFRFTLYTDNNPTNEWYKLFASMVGSPRGLHHPFKKSQIFDHDSVNSQHTMLLECGEGSKNMISVKTMELAAKGRYQYQMYGFPHRYYAKEVAPATLLRCEHPCLEGMSSTYIRVELRNDHLKCEINICGFIKSSDNKFKASFYCGDQYSSIIINYNFKVKVKNINQKADRILNKYDILEEIMCEVTFDKLKDAKEHLGVKRAKILLYTKLENSKINIINKDNVWIAKIPHSITNQLYYRCYFGDLKYVGDEMRYYVLKENQLDIASDELTVLESDNKNWAEMEYTYFEIYAFSDKSSLSCKQSYYTKAKYVNLKYFARTEELDYPFSEHMARKGKHNLDPLFNFQNIDTKGVSIYISCFYHFYIKGKKHVITSIPSLVYKIQLPIAKFIYINPPWKTDYFLRDTLILCKGEHVLSVEVNCWKCDKWAQKPYKKRDVSEFSISLRFNSNLKNNTKATLKCAGTIIDKGKPTYELKMFEFVIQKERDVRRQKIIEVNVDSFVCRDEFAVRKGLYQVVESIPIKTKLWIGETSYTNNDENIYLKVTKDNYGTNEYRYCCLTFQEKSDDLQKSKFNCKSPKKLLVTKEYKVQLNRRFDDIFAGVKLMCMVCVQYTIDIKMTCSSDRLINVPISMVVEYYNSSKKIINDVKLVVMPKDEYKNDNSSELIDADEYKITVGCRIRESEDPKMFRIHLKSCNSHPPKIILKPLKKTTFIVHDVFTCTTGNVDCEEKIKYTAKVIRDEKVIEEVNASWISLTNKHLGNTVMIVCEAGSVVKNNASRYVRVEHEPFNVRIGNLKPYMGIMEYLTCEVDGFPEPKITWSKLSGHSELKVVEYRLLISPFDQSDFYVYQCSATNYRGRISKDFNFTLLNFRMRKLRSLSLIYPIILVVSTFVFIVASCFAIVLIYQEYIFDEPIFSFRSGSSDMSSISEDEKIQHQRTISIINRKSVMDLHYFSKQGVSTRKSMNENEIADKISMANIAAGSIKASIKRASVAKSMNQKSMILKKSLMSPTFSINANTKQSIGSILNKKPSEATSSSLQKKLSENKSIGSILQKKLSAKQSIGSVLGKKPSESGSTLQIKQSETDTDL